MMLGGVSAQDDAVAGPVCGVLSVIDGDHGHVQHLTHSLLCCNASPLSRASISVAPKDASLRATRAFATKGCASDLSLLFILVEEALYLFRCFQCVMYNTKTTTNCVAKNQITQPAHPPR